MSELLTITLSVDDASRHTGATVDVPRRLGSVELKSEIGRGGTGVVYRGIDALLARDVAVKFLLYASSDAADQTFQDFVQGARAAAQVRHPGLCSIYNADIIRGVPFLVMEFVDGPTLSAIVRSVGALSWPAAAAVLTDVADAVAQLHERGILHRDIKPANVLLDADGRVRVTDFGMALLRCLPGATRARIAGTPAYMAPETFDGVVSERSDVYALGMTAFHVLAGSPPFGGTLDDLRRMHSENALPVAQLANRGVSDQVCDLIGRATHKNPVFRHKSATHFARALHETIDSQTLSKGALELAGLVTSINQNENRSRSQAETSSTPPTIYYERLSTMSDEKRRARGGEAAGASSGTGSSRAVSTVGPIVRAAIMLDVSCSSCAYNLRGLNGDGNCPECGQPVSESLKRERLLFADREWLRRVSRGHDWILVSCLLFPLIFVIVWPAVRVLLEICAAHLGNWTGMSMFQEFRLPSGTAFLGASAVIVFVFGIYWGTTPERARPGKSGVFWPRLATRMAGASAVVLSAATLLVTGPVSSPAMVPVGLSMTVVALLVALIGFVHILIDVGIRIPNPRIVRRLGGLARYLAVADCITLGLIGAYHALPVDPPMGRSTLLVALAAFWVLTGFLAPGALLLWTILSLRDPIRKVLAGWVDYDAMFSPAESGEEVPIGSDVLGVSGAARPVTVGAPPEEVGSVPSIESVPDAVLQAGGGGALVVDLPCVQCNYNLRYRRRNETCPECGEPVERSLDPDRLIFADPTWLRSVAQGQLMVFLAAPLALAGPLLSEFLAMCGWDKYVVNQYTGRGFFAWWLLFLATGVIVSTRRDLKRIVTGRSTLSRQAARIAIVLFATISLTGLFPLAFLRTLGWKWFQPAFGVALVLLGSGALVTWLSYQRTLAARIPHRVLLRLGSVATGLFGLTLLATIPGNLRWMNIATGTLIRNPQSPWLYHTLDQMIAVVGIGTLITVLLLLAGLRDAFKRLAAQHLDLDALLGAERMGEPSVLDRRLPAASGAIGNDGLPARDILVLRHCPQCHYDLAGLPRRHRCPECAFEYDESMFILYGWASESARPDLRQMLFGSRRISIQIAVGLATFLCLALAFRALSWLAMLLWTPGIIYVVAIWQWRRNRQKETGGAVQFLFSSQGASARRGPGRPQFVPWESLQRLRFRRIGPNLWRLTLGRAGFVFRLHSGSSRTLLGRPSIVGVIECSRRQAAVVRNEIRRRMPGQHNAKQAQRPSR